MAMTKAQDGDDKEKDAGNEPEKGSEQRAKDDSDDDGKSRRVRPKTGEPRDNLRRRSEWFQKRH